MFSGDVEEQWVGLSLCNVKVWAGQLAVSLPWPSGVAARCIFVMR